jgi:hypothetical protein
VYSYRHDHRAIASIPTRPRDAPGCRPKSSSMDDRVLYVWSDVV